MRKDIYKNNQHKRKAFTLIELLIVIAIIGILFIVLISKVDFATDKAKATGVQTDFRSFQVAIESVAKEKAGLNTFGWERNDANANGKRDNYDEGDANTNGIKEPGEIWTGHKIPGENWDGVYTLIKPGTDFETVGYDEIAILELETAINKNLDPKLHIKINHMDGSITMANGAQDPWNNEYHGYYITNAEVDGKDRGAIVIYSNGANQEFGSEHNISNGVVSVFVPNDNKAGKDDYSVAVVYTFANGYGEVKTSTSGFSQNQGNNGTNTSIPGGEENEDSNIQNTPTVVLNEYGFVYDVPYIYNAEEEYILVFHEDGTVSAAVDRIIDIIANDSTAIYNSKSIIVKNNGDTIFDFSVSDDGLTITEVSSAQYVYDPNKTLQSVPDGSIYMSRKHGWNEQCLYIPEVVYDYDVYVHGDYIYRFENSYIEGGGWIVSLATDDNLGYVDVWEYEHATTNDKTSYGEILSIVADKPIVSIYELFSYCENLIIAPTIPSTVVDMNDAFYCCFNLKTVGVIPDSVKMLSYTFANCESLNGNITVLIESIEDLWDYSGCFSEVDMSKIYLIGTGTNDDVLIALGETGLNWYGLEFNVPVGNPETPSPEPTPTPEPDPKPEENMGLYYYENGYSTIDSLNGNIYVLGDYIYVISEPNSGYGWDVCLATKDNLSMYDIDIEYPVVTKNQTSYQDMLSEIDGIYVVSATDTFAGCTKLITTPKLSEYLEDAMNTFYGCTSLTTVTELPSTLVYMCGTFENCTSLVLAPEIPECVENLEYTFAGCTSLVVTPYIPENVDLMGFAFAGCTSLTTITNFGSAWSLINAFEGCTSLVNVPDFWNAVDISGIFKNCTSLTNVPEIHTNFGNMSYAFAGCTSLSGEVYVYISAEDWMNYDYEYWEGMFEGVDMSNIDLIGDTNVVNDMGSTGNNWEWIG